MSKKLLIDEGDLIYYLVVNKDNQPLVTSNNGDVCQGKRIDRNRVFLFMDKNSAIYFLNNRNVEKEWKKKGRKIVKVILSIVKE